MPDAPYRLLHALGNAHSGQSVNSVRFNWSGQRLASGGSDGTAAIWDSKSGALVHRLKGHSAGISGRGCESRVGRRVATSKFNLSAGRRWKPAGKKCKATVHVRYGCRQITCASPCHPMPGPARAPDSSPRFLRCGLVARRPLRRHRLERQDASNLGCRIRRLPAAAPGWPHTLGVLLRLQRWRQPAGGC